MLKQIDNNEGFSIQYEEMENTYSVTYAYDGFVKSMAVTKNETASTTNLISGGKIVSVESAENSVQRALYVSDELLLSTEYVYSDEGISEIKYQDGRSLGYVYDMAGNIKSVSENGILRLSYEYDSLGQLVRENNAYANKTYKYFYDNAGNILAVREYEYSTGELLECVATKTYEYQDTSWKDLLTDFNAQKITYDEIGNPLVYRDDLVFSWNGRQLTAVQSADYDISYTYTSDGIRTSKTVNGVTTIYHLEDCKIVGETTDDETIWYIYDENDSVVGFEYLAQTYYLEKNAQGDILRVYDATGKVVCEYIYDGWGNVVEVLDNLEIAKINSFRYHGYYQDNETGFYYLQSRYYDSYVGRFLNADDSSYLGANEIVTGYNLFSYCINNPINYNDDDGHVARQLSLDYYLIKQLSVAMAGIISSIRTSMANIKIAIASSWVTAVCIAATAVAIVGIISVVNRAKKMMADAEKTKSSVKSIVKAGGLDTRRLSGHTVYVIARVKTTDVVYAGRIKNFVNRRYAHQGRKGCKFPYKDYDMVAVATGLSLAEARALEQTIITAYSLDTLVNMINSISPRKWDNFRMEFQQMKTLIEASFDPE